MLAAIIDSSTIRLAIRRGSAMTMSSTSPFAEDETVIRAVFKHQRVGLTLFCCGADTSFSSVICCAIALLPGFRQPRPSSQSEMHRHSQLGFLIRDGSGKELDIVFDGAIGRQGHPAGQHRARTSLARRNTGRLTVRRGSIRQAVRQIVGKGAYFAALSSFAASAIHAVVSAIATVSNSLPSAPDSTFSASSISSVLALAHGDEAEGGQIAARSALRQSISGGDAVRCLFLKIMVRTSPTTGRSDRR